MRLEPFEKSSNVMGAKEIVTIKVIPEDNNNCRLDTSRWNCTPDAFRLDGTNRCKLKQHSKYGILKVSASYAGVWGILLITMETSEGATRLANEVNKARGIQDAASRLAKEVNRVRGIQDAEAGQPSEAQPDILSADSSSESPDVMAPPAPFDSSDVDEMAPSAPAAQPVAGDILCLEPLEGTTPCPGDRTGSHTCASIKCRCGMLVPQCRLNIHERDCTK